jgi:hypothetical protein
VVALVHLHLRNHFLLRMFLDELSQLYKPLLMLAIHKWKLPWELLPLGLYYFVLNRLYRLTDLTARSTFFDHLINFPVD